MPRKQLDALVGLTLHRFQILPLPPVKDRRTADKLLNALLKVGLEENGFTEQHTFLVDVTPDAHTPILFVARMVKE